jgi:uncharacterized membrane protein (Fun14 family)
MTTDLAPFAGAVGGGFFVGFITGYAIKKVIKLAAVIVGLFIAAVAYLQYQRIINVDWERVQAFSQNGITWVVNAITQCLKYHGGHPFSNIINCRDSASV